MECGKRAPVNAFRMGLVAGVGVAMRLQPGLRWCQRTPAMLPAHLVRVPGLTDYGEAFSLQRRLQEEQIAGARGPCVLLVEHPPTITIGRRGRNEEVTAPAAVLRARGVAVHETDRGGQVTYHGPGQVVAYPLVPLQELGLGLHEYMRALEEAVIGTIGAWGIAGYRISSLTGVWVGREKICAMGIRVRRWWTMHGLALNVTTDLNHFGLIVPCGIRDRGVTSMELLLGTSCPGQWRVEEVLAGRLEEALGLELIPSSVEWLEPVPGGLPAGTE